MIREERYGEVRAFEIARSVAGRAIWTVRIFLVGKVLIDTGPPNMRRAVLDLARRLQPEAVLVTHHHEDHAGNAAALARELGLPVFASPLAVPLMADRFREAPFQILTWGRHVPAIAVPIDEPLELGGLVLEPVAAPGHSPDMTCWWVRDRGLLFSGDLYLADRIRFFREDESFAQTMRSLEHVSGLDFEALLCAHNPRPRNGPAHLRAKLSFMQGFQEEVAARAAQGQEPARIAKELLGSDWFLRWFTSGRACSEHLVRSALASQISGG